MTEQERIATKNCTKDCDWTFQYEQNHILDVDLSADHTVNLIKEREISGSCDGIEKKIWTMKIGNMEIWNMVM